MQDKQLNQELVIHASSVASFLNRDLHGEDILLTNPAFIDSAVSKNMTFVEVNHNNLDSLSYIQKSMLVITNTPIPFDLGASYIISDNPRLDFVRSINMFWQRKASNRKISDTAKIGSNVTLGENVSVGEYAVIEDNVIIGDNTVIGHHSIIGRDTLIGKRCKVEDHCIIGGDGLWSAISNDGSYEDITHLGKVKIQDDVRIGSFSSIDRGVLPDHVTLLEKGSRLSKHVEIAHGVQVGYLTRISIGAIICGYVKMGSQCWIGPGAVVRHKIEIVDHSYVGMNTVVNKNITEPGTYVGVPAKMMRKR